MSKQLLIKKDGLPDKINLLLENISKNDKALNEFVKNPFQVLAKNMPDEIGKMSATSISDSNKLLFAVLANNEFKNWLIKYQAEAEIEMSKPENANKSIEEIFPGDKVYKDLSAAIIEYGNQQILTAVLSGGGRGSGLRPPPDDDRLLPTFTCRAFGRPFVDIVIRIQKFRVIFDTIIRNTKLETRRLSAASRVRKITIKK